jgi:cadmium resistance protein CadD (predicted permease)
MSFGLYALGYVIVIIGLLYIAHLMHIPEHWMIGIGLVLLGIGVTSAVTTTRHKDPS